MCALARPVVFCSCSGIHTQLWRAGILHRIFTNCQLAYNGYDHYDVILSRQPIQNPHLPQHIPEIPNGKPKPLEEDNPTDSKDTSCKILKILSLNVNSWMLHRDSLIKQADVLVVQETRLTAAGTRSNTKFLQSNGIRAIHGEACPPVTFRKGGQLRTARASTPTGRQGGVAIFAKNKCSLQPCSCTPEVLPLFKTARWVHAACPPISSHSLAPTPSADVRAILPIHLPSAAVRAAKLAHHLRSPVRGIRGVRGVRGVCGARGVRGVRVVIIIIIIITVIIITVVYY